MTRFASRHIVHHSLLHMGLYSHSQSLYPCSQLSTIEKIFSEHASFDETHFFSAWILRGAPEKAILQEKKQVVLWGFRLHYGERYTLCYKLCYGELNFLCKNLDHELNLSNFLSMSLCHYGIYLIFCARISVTMESS